MHAVAMLATVFGKKSLTADDLIKPPNFEEANRPQSEEELQQKIARVLGGLG